MINNLLKRDLKHIWHPCAQMKSFETMPPIIIECAEGDLLFTPDGPVIDAISSWWCKPLGHCHPNIQKAIVEQLQQFEHVMGQHCTFEKLVLLGESLAEITNKKHVLFASDGASAVEMAMKLAIHAQQLKGNTKKTGFISLVNSYHGETLGALSLTKNKKYKSFYPSIQAPCHIIEAIPYVLNTQDELWEDASSYWSMIEAKLDYLRDTTCAIVVEPLIQGAGNMQIYSKDFLKRLHDYAKEHDIFFIADEIMTGFGKLDTWLALQQADISADIICIGKNLTNGTIPMSATLVSDEIFELFYDDKHPEKNFFHSHTHSGNALGVSAALATIKTLQEIHFSEKVNRLNLWMNEGFQYIQESIPYLMNVRSLGSIIAADLPKTKVNTDFGLQFYQEAKNKGALIRPIQNTIYWMPPLITSKETIGKLTEITLNSIKACCM